ncbi:MAG: DUF5522 domain-containing protein [Fimbriiglobus sp.]
MPPRPPYRPKHPLVEGRDYYIENGRWVFTETFHRERGYCCESGCRHCPYGFKKPPVASDIVDSENLPPS